MRREGAESIRSRHFYQGLFLIGLKDLYRQIREFCSIAEACLRYQEEKDSSAQLDRILF